MEWEVIVNQLIDLLLPTLATVLTGFLTYIGARLKTAYENKVTTETAKTVIENVVKCVQQTYKDLEGPAKLEKAVDQASEILASKGITITDAEITMLIESAVYGLKQGISTETKQITE